MISQEYQTFLVLSQTLSYTKTAHQLFISQPAVTQQIQRLETSLNLKLVIYKRPKLSLTHAGEQLAAFLTRTQAQAVKVLNNLQNDNQKQEISFGITRSLSEVIGKKMISIMLNKVNFTAIKCVAGNTTSILAQISNGTIDFGIVEGNFDKHTFSYHIIRNEPFIPLVSCTHPLARKKSVTWNDLLSYPLIIREEGSGSREILTSLAQKENISLTDFSQLLTISEPTLLRQLVKKGVGISFLYKILVENDLKQGILKQLPLPRGVVEHELYFVYAKESFFASDYQQWFHSLDALNN
ncbi:LysR family transcriptional regulator [Liquorilactobacillus mali]|uniref:LysR family transcriptional regulator n=1 Tax=Liquorilactobacillus mali TaxID=1618 RepID=UPI0026543645|nr:LysR family transcriptional regulator [Liquorilactobacillus mali]MDN7146238.1 LysR family transcriptional regulator [Liquorilactobacillus mali]